MSELARAVALLSAGELVAFPTETVYGLGADADNPAAVAKIFVAKGRPSDHPLIVHIADVQQLDQWAIGIPESARKLAETFWPGPLTLILKRHPDVSDAITGGQDTVGLRVPNHPLALQLLNEFAVGKSGRGRSGLVAPSANRFGRISPTTAAHVKEELGDRVSLILDGGPCAVGIESTILDLSNHQPRVLRPGTLSAATIANALGQSFSDVSQKSQVPRVSGSLEAHYAPQTALRLLPLTELATAMRSALETGSRVTVLARSAAPLSHPHLIWRTASDQPREYARALYANLRDLDGSSSDLILVELPPTESDWQGVLDRLRRASVGSGR